MAWYFLWLIATLAYICLPQVTPFADDEADDDDFQDEENMHLELNSSDSEHADDEDDEKNESRPKEFLKSAIQKTKRQDSTNSDVGESKSCNG